MQQNEVDWRPIMLSRAILQGETTYAKFIARELYGEAVLVYPHVKPVHEMNWKRKVVAA